jgi:hypothetical protein
MVVAEAAVQRRARCVPPVGGRAPAEQGQAVTRHRRAARPLPWLSCGGRAPPAPPPATSPIRVRITAWPAAAGGTLVLWSFTHLARPALSAGGTIASPLGDVALEGVALALAWLGAVLTACLGISLGFPRNARAGRTTAVTAGPPAARARRPPAGAALPVPPRSASRGTRAGPPDVAGAAGRCGSGVVGCTAAARAGRRRRGALLTGRRPSLRRPQTLSRYAASVEVTPSPVPGGQAMGAAAGR